MASVTSLRTRLLVGLAAMLAIVMAASAAMVCWFTWRALVSGVNAELDARVTALVQTLRPAQAAGSFDLDLPAEYRTAADDGRVSYYVLFAPDGGVIDRSDPDVDVAKPHSPGWRTREGIRERSVVTADGVTVLAGLDLAPARQEVWAIAAVMGAVSVVVLAGSIIGGRLVVGRALAPLDRIGTTAHAMSSGDLAARIERRQLDAELDRVARALNDAFDRLQATLEQERRFTADASHELRTPLATLATEVDWALSAPRSEPERLESLAVSQRAVARMRRTIEQLLALARADANEVRLALAPVRLDAVVSEAYAMVKPLADRRDIRIEITADPVIVHGDADRLVEAITNVMDNAVQYNSDRGHVRVQVHAHGTSANVVVRDTGPGIAPADLPHVFDRFYRADRARTSAPAGAGLGLAWSRWVIEAHGGRIVAESELGHGSTFTVSLPMGT